MSSLSDSSGSWSGRKLGRAAQVVVVSSVMFTFISYWRTAAVVLCDMSSTVYYIGAIVESAIGKAAPWFILAVLLFSYGDARRVHRKLRAVRARRRVSRRERSAGRISGQAGRLGAVVRLRAHRADQRRVGRAVHRRLDSGNADAACSACISTSTAGNASRTGARWRSPARSRCTSCGRICWAFTNRAARR